MPSTPRAGLKRLKVGVLISGRGSNLQALIDAAAAPDYPAEIAVVISNRADAPGLARAATAGIPQQAIALADRAAFAAAADRVLRDSGVELVALAGFMRILDLGFVAAWNDRMINIHPSLLPAFPGLHPQRQALAAGVRFSGCTVHFADNEYDHGPIILQKPAPVLDDDTPDSLADRVFQQECEAYPEAIQLFAEGRLRIEGQRVRILAR